MSIELIQAAQQALSALENSRPHPSNPFIGLTKQDFTDHEETIRQLRNALQQPAHTTQTEVTDEQKDFDDWWDKEKPNTTDAYSLSWYSWQARAILALCPERVQMTDTQLCEALGIDGSDDWTYQVRDAVEAHHFGVIAKKDQA